MEAHWTDKQTRRDEMAYTPEAKHMEGFARRLKNSGLSYNEAANRLRKNVENRFGAEWTDEMAHEVFKVFCPHLVGALDETPERRGPEWYASTKGYENAFQQRADEYNGRLS